MAQLVAALAWLALVEESLRRGRKAVREDDEEARAHEEIRADEGTETARGS